METITLSDQQQRRVQILERLIAGKFTVADAARLLQRSERQVLRMKQAYQQKGMAAVVHGNTSRVPANKTDAATREKLRELAGPKGVYQEYNTCHLAEVLARDHDLTLGRATLERLLLCEGLRKRKRAGERVVRKRRKRRAAEGAMLQIDGSPYAWLGTSQPSLCLLGAIDDATGKIAGLLFRPTEDQAGYLLLLRSIAVKQGLPESVYHDKHTILRSPKEATLEEELAGKPPMSQVQRVLDLLGIASITAHSPQAKGRIERLWKTLQDRLSKELATRGITTLEEANAYLPEFIVRFNLTFAIEARDLESRWMALEPQMDLDYYFSTLEIRTVKADHTLAYFSQTLQLLPDKRAASLTGQQVEVHALPEGALVVYHKRKRIPHKKLAAAPVKTVEASKPKLKPVAPGDPAVKQAARRRQMAHLHTSTR
jgi:transposase